VVRELDDDELIDRWTLSPAEVELVAGKRGATRLGFALLLRFYTEQGRFPRGRREISHNAIDYVARQVGVERTEIAFYEWTGRTIEYHRSHRTPLVLPVKGFRLANGRWQRLEALPGNPMRPELLHDLVFARDSNHQIVTYPVSLVTVRVLDAVFARGCCHTQRIHPCGCLINPWGCILFVVTIQGESISAFAARVGLSVNTLKHYRRQHMLPKADVEIVGEDGAVEMTGWFPETMDTWQAERPGRGNRFYTND
jgi:hypothetical protein